MTDQPDMTELAARYLDLWQEQVAQLANDPALAEMMANSYALVRQRWQEAANQINDVTHNRKSAAAGSAAAAFSPDDAGHQLAELARRLAALEERFGQLEASLQPAGKRPQKPDKKPGRKRVPSRPK
jgi:hypothetical protein